MRSLAILSFAAALAACGGEPDADTDAPELDLDGAAYTLDVSGLGVAGADPGLATLIKLFFTRTVLIGLHDVTDDALTLRMGFAAQGDGPVTQDPCTQTLQLPPASRDGLTFDLGPQTVTFEGAEIDYDIQDLTVDGAISADGERLQSLVLGGRVDLRQVEALGFGTAESLCGSMSDLGKPCGDCDDDAPYCAELQIEGLSAQRVEATVEAIDALDPSCAEDE